MGCNFSVCANEAQSQIMNRDQLEKQKKELLKLNESFIQKFEDLPNSLTVFNKKILPSIIEKNFLRKIPLPSVIRNILENEDNSKQRLFESILKYHSESDCRLFSLTVNSYQEYLAKLFNVQCNLSPTDDPISLDYSTNYSFDGSFYSQPSPTHSIYETPKSRSRQKSDKKLKSVFTEVGVSTKLARQSKKIISNSNLLQSEESCNFLVEQYNFIFGFLHEIIEIQFVEFLDACFSDDPNNFPEREFSIQSVLQHYFHNKSKSFSFIIQLVVQQYYSFYDSKQKDLQNYQIKNQSDENLRSTLIPKCEIRQSQLIYSQTSSFEEFHQPQINNLKTISEDFEDEDVEELKQLEENFDTQFTLSEDHRTHQKCHYSELFPLIKYLIITTKFWRKFKYILKIDQQIEIIFMRKRTLTQQDHYYDQITAVDSKMEVLIYVLRKFANCYPQYDLKNDLYNSLRLMMDFDNILHYSIKYVHQPQFLTFYEIITKYISSK